MKKILAVSGGIDSVVLLHLLKDEAPIVAHFDHGIRTNSSEDAKFVEKLAVEYGLKFEQKRMELGEKCSEATARAERYRFLSGLAEKYGGVICVAHHADDVIESIAINLLRGTGWRGLAPMNSNAIVRPLLKWRKRDIYRYAAENNLSFRQDQTNTEGNYLRNIIREKLILLPEETKNRLLEVYEKQSNLYSECEGLLQSIVARKDGYYSKDIIENSSDECAIEIIRYVLAQNNISLTRPQLHRCVEAIRNYSPMKRLSLNGVRFLEVGRYNYRVI